MPLRSAPNRLLLTFLLGALALTGCKKYGASLLRPDGDGTVAAEPASDGSSGGGRLFVRSAHENGDGTATLPLHRGTSGDRTVWFIVLDASTGDAAKQWGVNESQKLMNLRGTGAVQKVTMHGDVIDFPASVDFTPVRSITPSPQGFPPADFHIGAQGEDG